MSCQPEFLSICTTRSIKIRMTPKYLHTSPGMTWPGNENFSGKPLRFWLIEIFHYGGLREVAIVHRHVTVIELMNGSWFSIEICRPRINTAIKTWCADCDRNGLRLFSVEKLPNKVLSMCIIAVDQVLFANAIKFGINMVQGALKFITITTGFDT